MEAWREAAHWVPFVGLINRVPRAQDGVKVFKSPLGVRLTEALIIGAVVMYGSVEAAKRETAYLRDQIVELKTQVSVIREKQYQMEIDTWRNKRESWLLAGAEYVH